VPTLSIFQQFEYDTMHCVVALLPLSRCRTNARNRFADSQPAPSENNDISFIKEKKKKTVVFFLS
jgi:hypothetical protein